MKLKLLGATVALAMGAAGQAAVLFDNGPVVDGSNLSILDDSTHSTIGLTSNSAFVVADNFSVAGSSWNVESLDFFAYQTGANSQFTFTSATWSIVSGTDVNNGAMVASGTTAVSNGGLVGYRVLASLGPANNRAIFRINADIVDVMLSAGDYFLTWSLAGDGVGPYVPPVLGSFGTGNALQGSTGGTLTLVHDSGNNDTYDLPFAINGTAGAVPEPMTWALMVVGFGVVGGILRRQQRLAVA